MRFNTHISKEVFKGVSPPVADGDATPTIIRIIYILWVIATSIHIQPRLISWCMRHSVSDKFLVNYFTMETPARCRFSLSKQVLANIFNLAALTFTSPHPYRATNTIGLYSQFRACLRQNGESAKNKSLQILPTCLITLNTETPATSAIPGLEISRTHNLNRPAITKTFPKASTLTSLAHKTQNDPSVKALIGQILKPMMVWMWLKFNVIFIAVQTIFSLLENVWIRAVSVRLTQVRPAFTLAQGMDVS